jgi:hypothetical protein
MRGARERQCGFGDERALAVMAVDAHDQRLVGADDQRAGRAPQWRRRAHKEHRVPAPPAPAGPERAGGGAIAAPAVVPVLLDMLTPVAVAPWFDACAG